jgi:hypothetical protein
VVVCGQQSSRSQLNARAEHKDPSQLGRPRKQRLDRYLHEAAKSSIASTESSDAWGHPGADNLCGGAIPIVMRRRSRGDRCMQGRSSMPRQQGRVAEPIFAVSFFSFVFLLPIGSWIPDRKLHSTRLLLTEIAVKKDQHQQLADLNDPMNNNCQPI